MEKTRLFPAEATDFLKVFLSASGSLPLRTRWKKRNWNHEQHESREQVLCGFSSDIHV